MIPKKELQLAYTLAGILLVVGILSYAASSAQPPVPPLRIIYRTVAGRVLFDHKAHFSTGDYSISCQDCHHDLRTYDDYNQVGEEDQSLPEASLDLHDTEDLHDTDEIEDVEMFKDGDAAHELCIGCHEEYEAGPIDCQGCHVM